MMDSEDNNVVDDRIDERVSEAASDFGAMLSDARKAQDYSISDIHDNIKIPVELLSAIEACDLAALPATTFTRGYIRSYARFLEISEDRVLDLYHQALPDSSTPDERQKTDTPARLNDRSSSNKKLPLYLIIAAMIAVIYTGYRYSLDETETKADSQASIGQSDVASEETVSEVGSNDSAVAGNTPSTSSSSQVDSAQSPDSQTIQIEQNASLTSDDELILTDGKQEPNEETVEAGSVEVSPETVSDTGDTASNGSRPAVSDKNETAPVQTSPVQTSTVPANHAIAKESPQEKAEEQFTDDRPSGGQLAEESFPDDWADDPLPEKQSTDGQTSTALAEDSITFYAEDGSWIEVRDANDLRLFYNMLPEGDSKTLTGQAPFSVTMGNAKTTHVQINDIDVDFSNRIRSTNTASFKVSNEGQRVILRR